MTFFTREKWFPKPIPQHWPSQSKPPLTPEKRDLSHIPYGGTRYRICTDAPNNWWVEHFGFKREMSPLGEPVLEEKWHLVVVRTRNERHYSASDYYDEEPIIYPTRDRCVAWIDKRVRSWRLDEERRLENAAHVAANPPEEYP